MSTRLALPNRLMRIALQYASLEKLGDLVSGAQFASCGPVLGHHHLKHCSSLPDLIGRHLLVEYLTSTEGRYHDYEG